MLRHILFTLVALMPIASVLHAEDEIKIEALTPVELELKRLDDLVQAAEAKVEKIIEAATPELNAAEGEKMSEIKKALAAQIAATYEDVQKEFKAATEKYSTDARIFFAYAEFVHENIEEDDSIEIYEKSRELDPKNADSWSRLAEIYAHLGPIEKSFEYYDESICLNPKDAYEFYNYGTVVFLFRPDAREYYGITEAQVFEKALDLYESARLLKPKDFELASLIAESYYGVRTLEVPVLTERAMKAWETALSIATDDLQKESVAMHFARWNMKVERYDDAQKNLDSVKYEEHLVLKNRLQRDLDRRRSDKK